MFSYVSSAAQNQSPLRRGGGGRLMASASSTKYLSRCALPQALQKKEGKNAIT
jgi:hypothetical protein